jgi:lysophospholipase L1-like esterase
MELKNALAFAAGAAVAVAVAAHLHVGARERRHAPPPLRTAGDARWATAPACIVCVGDSLTELGADAAANGWTSLLGGRYARRADVLNRGFSGYTSRLLKAMLPDLLAQLETAYGAGGVVAVTLLAGTNDATAAGGFQHVPPDEFEGNVRMLLAGIRAAFPDALVLALAPPPVDSVSWDAYAARSGFDGGGRSAALVAQYGELVRRAAASTGADFLDLRTALPERSALSDDGLHLSASGNERLFKLVDARLQASARAAVERLPEYFPCDCVAAPALVLGR